MSSTDNDQVLQNLNQSMALNKESRESLTAHRLALMREQKEVEAKMDRHLVVTRLKDPTQADFQFLLEFQRGGVK